MKKNYFKGLIKCKSCGRNYNYRNEHGTEVFICSTAKNYGRSKCPDSPRINLDDLIFMIEQHCKIYNKNFELNKVKLFIRKIDVEPSQITIYYKDGTKGIMSKDQIIF